MRILAPILFAAFAVAFAQAGLAEPYTLVGGDEIELQHAGLAEPKAYLIDVDGQVRLTGVGGVDVTGKTLDEAGSAIAAALSGAGLYVQPQVSVAMSKYAPIVVAGDVLSPGRIEYVPGMTIQTALAMAGGGQTAGLTRGEIARARAETDSGLKIANLEIAAAAVSLARHSAALEEAEVTLSADLVAQIPQPTLLNLAELVTNEAAILSAERERRAELLAFWEREIGTISEQIELFDARIALQDEVISSTAEALADARTLQERGLQTSQRFAAIEQRAGDAQSRALELQSAKITAAAAVSVAQRARVQYLANWRQEALEGAQAARIALENAQARYERSAQQRAILTGATTLGVEAVAFRFSLQTMRERRGDMAVSSETLLLPGDTLIVQIDPLATGKDG